MHSEQRCNNIGTFSVLVRRAYQKYWDFAAAWALVATWENVRPYSLNMAETSENVSITHTCSPS